MFKLYCTHPISGLSYAEVINYYEHINKVLSPHFIILSPMTGKESMRTELEFKSCGYEGKPTATNQAIVNRDRWMVDQADIVFINLINATERVSIGTVCELAWAYDTKKHIVSVIGDGNNIHKHAFVLVMGGTIFNNTDDAISYLLDFGSR